MLGNFIGTIQENSIRSAGTGTEYVLLSVVIEGAMWPVQIWMSEKSAGIAKGQLKVCGFNVDEESLAVLDDNPKYLNGRQIPVEIYEEEYKGKLQTKVRIVTAHVSKKRISALEAILRNVGKDEGEPVSATVEDDIPF